MTKPTIGQLLTAHALHGMRCQLCNELWDKWVKDGYPQDRNPTQYHCGKPVHRDCYLKAGYKLNE